ncbi:MAG TPA: VOC family protein [Actinomycetota bacterium]|nr:VOC family protein [Actinomycetota bacterium]
MNSSLGVEPKSKRSISMVRNAGAAYIRETLGVELEPGGEHGRMGTHNRLLKLGDTAYLEVLAVKPLAPKPGRSRWFGLDALGSGAPPRLATWVVRVDDINAAARACPGCGVIEPMTRGTLEWRITIPADGSLPFDGVMPTLIQWKEGAHPASRMTDRGCRLVKIAAGHPQAERVWNVLRKLKLEGSFAIESDNAPRLTAVIETPHGLCTL